MLFLKETWNTGKLYKLSGRRKGSAAKPQLLHEPRRPRDSLMMSLPCQTETHWVIMQQIFLSPPMPFHLFTPHLFPLPVASRLPSFYLLPGTYQTLSLHTSCVLFSDFLRALLIWSRGNMLRDIGKICWCSLPTLAVNQWKSYFGDEQRGSCFFHELLYNGITQQEGQRPHHGGLRRFKWSNCFGINSEYRRGFLHSRQAGLNYDAFL